MIIEIIIIIIIIISLFSFDKIHFGFMNIINIVCSATLFCNIDTVTLVHIFSRKRDNREAGGLSIMVVGYPSACNYRSHRSNCTVFTGQNL